MANLSSKPKSTSPLQGDDLNGPPRKATCATRGGQCTHMTMTRLYSGDFRCAMCLQPGPMGWLYRCTQDRELLIEDDMERGILEPFDQLATMFPVSPSPKKGSPAARTSGNLAFLDEISEEGFKSYTPVQVSTILKQRTQLLEVVKESESSNMKLTTEGLHLNFSPDSQVVPFPSFSTSSEIIGPLPQKSWLPTQECQFKCCHRCRPTFRERSFLSLDAVADGEIPATATSGFGFHFQKERPVALVEHVRNLGLRPNPIVAQTLYRRRRSRVSSLPAPLPSPKVKTRVDLATSSSPFNDEQNADTTFGQVSNAYDSTAMTRSLNIESVPMSNGGGNSFGATVRKAFEDMMLIRRHGAEVKDNKKLEKRKDPHKTAIRPPWTPPNTPTVHEEKAAADGTAFEDETPGSNGRSTRSLKTNRGLRKLFNLDESHEDGDVGLFLPLDDALLSRACAIALPVESPDE